MCVLRLLIYPSSHSIRLHGDYLGTNLYFIYYRVGGAGHDQEARRKPKTKLDRQFDFRRTTYYYYSGVPIMLKMRYMRVRAPGTYAFTQSHTNTYTQIFCTRRCGSKSKISRVCVLWSECYTRTVSGFFRLGRLFSRDRQWKPTPTNEKCYFHFDAGGGWKTIKRDARR